MPFIVNKCGVRAEGSREARTFLVESPRGTLRRCAQSAHGEKRPLHNIIYCYTFWTIIETV